MLDSHLLSSVLARLADGSLAPEDASASLRTEGIRLRQLANRYLREAKRYLREAAKIDEH